MARDGAIWVLKTGTTLPPILPARGDFEAWFQKGLGLADGEVEVCSAHAGDPLPDPASIAGVVVTGSPGMVTAREDWSEAAARWLGALVERDALPVLGVCYGHQLMAHGLGGEVAPNPRGREMGTVEVRVDEGATAGDALMQGGAFPVHMSHVESVVRRPADAVVMGETDLEPHAVLRFGPRQWGVQFHPEFDRDIMRRYVEARREVLAQEGFDADAMIEGAQETPTSTAILERFVALVRGG